MPEITVIMPALNVAKYIRPCIESVINQSFTDLEILFIDAGSTDGTLEIMQEYASKDSRIQLIHSDKKSYGYQMNLGISLARGKYIGVVETDDYIEEDMYEVLYEACVRKDADFAKGYTKQFYTIDNEEKYFFTSNTFFVEDGIDEKEIETSKMPEILIKDRFLWLGLYKSSFVKKIRLNETPGAAFQDQGFLLQSLSTAKKAVYVNKPVYYYRQDNNNASSHDMKGVGYIAREYELNRHYLEGKEIEWHTAFYTRMYDQMEGRFNTMAKSGEFWKDAVADIDIIRGWLQNAVDVGYLSEKKLDAERWRKLNTFLADRESIYKEYLEKYTSIKKEFNSLLVQIGDNPVVIFGAGKYGSFLYKILKKNQKNVVAFCDNNENLHNTKRNDKCILSLEDAIKKYNKALFIIANANQYIEMEEQLIKQGIEEERIGVYRLGEKTLLFGM